jgi:vacuolar-type H+-ATPase subunit F/Vma7
MVELLIEMILSMYFRTLQISTFLNSHTGAISLILGTVAMSQVSSHNRQTKNEKIGELRKNLIDSKIDILNITDKFQKDIRKQREEYENTIKLLTERSEMQSIEINKLRKSRWFQIY